MTQTYNSQYYIDIFKWVLLRKLQKASPETDSFFLNSSGIDISTIFPSKNHKRSQSSQSEALDTLKEKILKNQLELTESRKNKARLYNENLQNKVLLMKKRKDEDFKKRKEKMEIQQKSKEKRFERLLYESQRKLKEKIRTNSRKREENMAKVLKNRLKNEDFSNEKKPEEIETSSEKSEN